MNGFILLKKLGPVADVNKEREAQKNADQLKTMPQPAMGTDQFHHRVANKSGVRNMQDSSFALSGDQWDDQPVRSGTRVKNPPGGKSSGIF
jgi:hypothetical protein